MERDTVLSLRDICKEYPGVQALDHVSIDFRAGEVHALWARTARASPRSSRPSRRHHADIGSICLPTARK